MFKLSKQLDLKKIKIEQPITKRFSVVQNFYNFQKIEYRVRINAADELRSLQYNNITFSIESG